MGVAGQCHAPATLLPGTGTQVPFDRKLGGPQVWSGWVQKSHHPLGIDPRLGIESQWVVRFLPIACKIYLLLYFIDIVFVEQYTFKYNAVENIVHAFIWLVLFTAFRD